jgi:hypothetical protein
VALACEITAWTQMLALTEHPARRWEPKRLRLRLFSIAARLARSARRTRLHLGLARTLGRTPRHRPGRTARPGRTRLPPHQPRPDNHQTDRALEPAPTRATSEEPSYPTTRINTHHRPATGENHSSAADERSGLSIDLS